MESEACRADVWLWRARLFKTRGLAAGAVEAGRIRVNRGDVQTRPTKPSRVVRTGDLVVFAAAGKLFAVRIEGIGARRGPPAEARSLYTVEEEPR